MIEVSIIIPSFNTKKLLGNCLKSIFKQTKNISFEVIVVDNASTYNIKYQISNIKKKLKIGNIKLIKNKKNLGFAKAVNQGIKKAKGKYILLLNSDVIILDNAINKSLNFSRRKANVDILGCQLLNKDLSVQPSGGFFPHLPQVFYMMFFIDDLPLMNRFIKPYQQRRLSFYQKIRQLDWLTGAFLLIKRNIIDKIGGFDESFFMYGEEVEFCFRAKKSGGSIWFYPKAKVIHLKGKSSKNGFRQAVLGEYQGLKKFYRKHKPVWQNKLLKFLLKIGAVSRILIFGILGKDKNKKDIYEKAFKLV